MKSFVLSNTSGKGSVAIMRKACNQRLHNAFYHWARVEAQSDPWSTSYDHRLRTQGETHGRALRGLADRVLAVACSMLRNRTVYDPTRHVAAG